MDEFVEKMVSKVGIDKATAHRVIDFLKEHSEEAVGVIGKNDTVKGLMGKLPGGLGDKLGF